MTETRTSPHSVRLERDECLQLLATSPIGRVVVPLGASARPLIRPVNFVFDAVSRSVVFRSVPGTKLHALTRAPLAWFEADALDLELRVAWSVIVEGPVELVTRPLDVRRLQTLPLHSWIAGEQAPLVRIRARTVSGRRVVAAPG